MADHLVRVVSSQMARLEIQSALGEMSALQPLLSGRHLMVIGEIQIAFARDKKASDEEIARVHRDSTQYPIARWRAEVAANKTALPYIDWRCDKLWCAAQRRKIQ